MYRSLFILFLFMASQAQELRLLTRADGHDVPVLLYGDWHGEDCPDTLILSHGVGGDERSMVDLAQYISDNGIRVALIGHKESGPEALAASPIKGKKLGTLTSKNAHAKRFEDLEAVVALTTRHCRPEFMALGGHSMGAATALVAAGAKGRFFSRKYDVFDAYVALSPQGVGWMYKDEYAWRRVKKPVLVLVGTRDESFDGDYTSRLEAFEYMPPGKKRLGLIKGAQHVGTSGKREFGFAQQVQTLVWDFLDMRRRGVWERSRPVEGVKIEDK